MKYLRFLNSLWRLTAELNQLDEIKLQVDYCITIWGWGELAALKVPENCLWIGLRLLCCPVLFANIYRLWICWMLHNNGRTRGQPLIYILHLCAESAVDWRRLILRQAVDGWWALLERRFRGVRCAQSFEWLRAVMGWKWNWVWSNYPPCSGCAIFH